MGGNCLRFCFGCMSCAKITMINAAKHCNAGGFMFEAIRNELKERVLNLSKENAKTWHQSVRGRNSIKVLYGYAGKVPSGWMNGGL